MRLKKWANKYVYGLVSSKMKCKYLAKTKGQSISISSTYIVFLTKLQKRQTPEKRFASIENDITDFLPAPEIKIHSRYSKVG